MAQLATSDDSGHLTFATVYRLPCVILTLTGWIQATDDDVLVQGCWYDSTLATYVPSKLLIYLMYTAIDDHQQICCKCTICTAS